MKNMNRRRRCGAGGDIFVFVLTKTKINDKLLAHLIRHSSYINGIKIGDTEVLLTQFADDMSCFVNDENSIRQIFSMCNEFYYTSGLALNAEKSTILWLGNWKQKKYTLCGAAMCDDKYSLLGLTLSRDVTSTAFNLNDKIIRMENKLVTWSSLDLTIIGKILITKSMGLSNLNYITTHACLTKEQLIRIQRKINSFIWDNKIPKIKHTTLTADYKQRGLRSPDITSIYKSQRLIWLADIYKNSPVVNVLNECTAKYGGSLFLLKCNYDVDELTDVPLFYKELFEFVREIFTNKAGVSIIWNNKHIKIDKHTVFWKEWYEGSIVYIQDIMKENTFLEYEELCQRYSFRPNYLRYFSLINAIKSQVNHDRNIGNIVIMKNLDQIAI